MTLSLSWTRNILSTLLKRVLKRQINQCSIINAVIRNAFYQINLSYQNKFQKHVACLVLWTIGVVIIASPWIGDTVLSKPFSSLFCPLKSRSCLTVVSMGNQQIHLSHIDLLVQERRNYSTLAMKLRLFCINPSIWTWNTTLGHCFIHLTHLPLVVISQTISSDAFLWMKRFVFWLKFQRRLFLRFQLTITQHWFR